MSHWTYFLIGGIIVGIAASIMLVFNGRIMGASGIISRGIFSPIRNSQDMVFVIAMILTGAIISFYSPQLFDKADISWARLILAGLLVGFGSRLGLGCTSGHGICGVSRLSPRSIVATITFVSVAILTTLIINLFPK